jgi:hypothetical protein
MLYASIYYRNYINNDLFSATNGENGKHFYLPYKLLREAFAEVGVIINTPDLNKDNPVAFELYINCQRVGPERPAYVYLYENPLIRPLNRDMNKLNQYIKWFTWDVSLHSNVKAIPLFYPNRIATNEWTEWNGWSDRPIFCSLIASNKAHSCNDERDMYSKRVDIINWYEKNAPNVFHLYGQGWDQPPRLSGCCGRILNQIKKYLSFDPAYSIWKGTIEDKIAVLNKSRFCIAYENTENLDGYITEKIFDCFQTGCVPVYIGPSNITDFIPVNCFIDGRQFNNNIEALHRHLCAVDDKMYDNYQQNIRLFLTSNDAYKFSNEHFVKVIVDTIAEDLKLTKKIN